MPSFFNRIESIQHLDDLFSESAKRPVVIFKHSNSCGISFDVFENMSLLESEVNIVVVQEARHISDAVAARTGYRHQSPQAFVIKNGKVIYQASHYAINATAIERKIAE